MKYLLLGGAGFIGTHLGKRLRGLGHNVIVVDNLATAAGPSKDCSLFIQADIRTYNQLESLIKWADIIYFLAGSVGVEHIDKHPKKTFDNNIGLMNRCIPLFEKYQKKVIFSSTSEVYGDGPFSEDNALSIGAPPKMRWAYAAAKLLTEFAICGSTFPYTIYRFFNVVGPGQLPDHGMVLPRFIRAAQAGDDLIVYGDGNQVRSFSHVSDAVNTMIHLESVNNQIFNLGNEDPITIRELAERVISVTGSKSKIKFVPYAEAFSKNHGDIIHRVPNLTKLKTYSTYTPQHDLDSIIRDSL